MAKAGLKSTDAVGGGGLPGNGGPADITVTGSRFEKFKGNEGDYVALVFQYEDANGNAYEERFSYYAYGTNESGENEAAPITPTADGNFVEYPDSFTSVGPSKKCPYVRLANSLKESGFNESALDAQGAAAIVGIKGKVQREVKVGKDGVALKNDKGFDKTILLFKSIDPASVSSGVKGTAAPKAKAAGAAANSKANGHATEVDLDTEAVSWIESLLPEGTDSFVVNKILFKAKATKWAQNKGFTGEQQKEFVTKLESPDFFTETLGGAVAYDGKKLTRATA